MPENTGDSSPQSRKRKTGIRSAGITFMLLVPCASILLLSCWFGGYNCAGQAGTGKTTQLVASTSVGASGSSDQNLGQVDCVTAACELIARGQFLEAANRIAQAESADSPRTYAVREIVQQYEQVHQRRQTAKEAAFKKQLAELEKLRITVDLERLPRLVKVGDKEDLIGQSRASEPNEPNSVTDALAVIAKAVEFADSTQKTALLADPFVTKVMQKAVDHSATLESQGRWLDAYTSYFYWLQAIDSTNKGYSTHAEELVDMASIAGSFQDSPCETCNERYEGVEKYMFERAMDALNLHYVNSIDYVQMANSAVKRCDLLAQVLTTAYVDGSELAKKTSFEMPGKEKVTAWSVSLAGLRDEIESSVEKFGKDEFLKVLDKVVALNETTIQLPKQPLISHFVEAALGVLDPYTVIVWPRQVQDFEKLMTNEFTGIGIEISKPKGMLTVSSLLPDTPAYRSGLDAGDVIECVDGVLTKDMSLMCAVKKITGPKGTDVNLTIRRQGEQETRAFTITRDRIIVPTIRGWQRTEAGSWLYMLDEQSKVGYIRITSFSGDTADGLERTLKQLESEGLKGLILDLRFNTGGLLDSAVNVVDKFISEGLIVRTQPKANMIPAFEHAHRRGTHPEYPMVILVNSGSASASEIVAGALADPKYKRAILVGTRTHGKGSVQGITHYPGGGAELKYTMAYYHLPSGQRVMSREACEKEGHKNWGVGPDIEVDLTSEELREMLDVQRDNDVLVQANRNESSASVKKRVLDETLKSDPQLAVGLLVVKAKLLNAEAAIAAK